MSLARRLASLLLRHAGWVLQPARAGWADSMSLETQHIADDREALFWAAGCILAAYHARARTELFFLPTLMRLFLAGGCLLLGYSRLFWVWSWARCYGAQLMGEKPGIICQLQLTAIAPEHYLSWSAIGCLYVLAAFRMLLNRSHTFWIFVAATVLDLAATAYVQTIQGPNTRLLDIGIFPGMSRMEAYGPWYGPYIHILVVPFYFAVIIWLMDRYRTLRRSDRTVT